MCEYIDSYISRASNSKVSFKFLEIELQGRWKVLRDGFFRSKRNKRGGSATKLYIYHEELLFLDVLNEGTGGRNSYDAPTAKRKNNKTQKKNAKAASPEDTLIESLTKNIIEKITEVSSKHVRQENDEDRQFLLSLVEDFKNIPDEQKLNAKSDIIDVIKSYTYVNRFQGDEQYRGYPKPCTSSDTEGSRDFKVEVDCQSSQNSAVSSVFLKAEPIDED